MKRAQMLGITPPDDLIQIVRHGFRDSAIVSAVVGVDGTLLAVNPAYCNAVGLEEREILGQHATIFLGEEGRRDILSDLEQLASGAISCARNIHSLRHVSGRLVVVDTTLSAHYNDDGLLDCIFGYAIDITEDHNVSRDMRAARDRLGQVLSAKALGVVEVDRSTRLVVLDERARAMFGLDIAPLGAPDPGPGAESGQIQVHQLMARLKRLACNAQQKQALASLFQAGQSQQTEEGGREYTLHLERADGTVVWLRLGIVRRGRRRIVASVVDVTQNVDRLTALFETRAALSENQRLLETATNFGSVGLWKANLATGVMWWNSTIGEMSGIGPTEDGMDAEELFRKILHPADVEPTRNVLTKAAADPAGRYVTQMRMIRPGGGYFWAEARGKVFCEPGSDTFIYGALVDITRFVEDRDRLRETLEEADAAHGRLMHMTNSLPGGIYEFVRTADGKISVPYANTGFERLLGMDKASLREDASAMYARVHPDDIPALIEKSAESARTLRPWHGRFRMTGADGIERWISAQSTPHSMPDGAIKYYGTLFDVTEDVRNADALNRARIENEHLAQHDTLTGLPNRRYFDEELARRLAFGAGRSSAQALTLIRIDLDNFKYVNDTLGHDAGDAVLRHVAASLRECINRGDFAARVGGDEFVVVLSPGRVVTGERGAEALVARLQQVVARPLTHNGRLCRFGVSFGVATSGDLDEEDPGRLLTYADLALYEAKAQGRGRMVVFTPALHSRTLDQRQRAQELLHALENGEITPHFQPQIDVATGQIAGFEVLARWSHPKRGLLLPSAFLEIAEQINQIQTMDRVVFQRAFAVLTELREEGLDLPKLSFNVSAARLHDEDFVDTVRWGRAHGVRVAVELLESIVLEKASETMRFHLDLLREQGVEIEVDDFGSGRASIVGVMKVAPDAIKLDQQLVLPIIDDPRMQDVLRHLIAMARTLDVEVIAEGVETGRHAELLAELGATTLQGFLFGKPLSPRALRGFLKTYQPIPILQGEHARSG